MADLLIFPDGLTRCNRDELLESLPVENTLKFAHAYAILNHLVQSTGADKTKQVNIIIA